jgi:DNA-binding CsgD family transcriptional regulator
MKTSRYKMLTQLILGEEDLFEPEHRFLNLICLLIGIAYFLTLPINLSLGINNWTTTVNFTVTLLFSAIYYLARFRRMFNFPATFLFIVVILSLSIDWLINGGIIGGISFYYFSLLVIILFLFKNIARVLLSLIIIIIVLFMSILEYFNPEWIIGYESRKQMFLDHTTNFIFASPFIILAVYYSRQLYEKEKLNTISIIEKYRSSSEFLKEQMKRKIEILSVREREIFRLIIEGKSNKEIASTLFISDLTVKKHITSLFKKIGARKRYELFNINT